MDEYQTLVQTIALTAGAAWASGINLYAVILVLGLGGATDAIALPPELEVVENPMVIMAAGLMYFVEFFADKIPGVDTTWDALHTFVRIPAGAMLAAGAMGDVAPAWEITAGILGGGLAATSHATKAGTRALINTSPEPFTNMGASVAEDVAVFAGLWAAVSHPWVFLGLLVLFLALAIWLLPKLLRGILALLRAVGRLFGYRPAEPPEPVAVAAAGGAPAATGRIDELERLQALRASGALAEEEFAAEKARVLGRPDPGAA